jgi:signal transduction histidine kinase
MTNRTRARLAFSVGTALLIVSAIAACVTIVQFERTVRRISHSSDIEVSLADVESSISAAGRARSAYVSSGNDAMYAQFVSSSAVVPAKMERLRQLTAAIPAHEDFYPRLSAMVESRMNLYNTAVERRRQGVVDSAFQDNITARVVTSGNEMKSFLEEMQQHEQEFSQERRSTSNVLFGTALSILGCAFLLSLGLLYWHYSLLRAELEEKERAEASALESREALRSLSARLLQVQDEERRRFSRELHDSLGQYLVLAKMNLSRLAQNQLMHGLLEEPLRYIDQSIAETRTISYLLHPPLLDEVGFASAAEWYVEGFAQRSGIEVQIDIPDKSTRLPIEKELALFRVLQESLTNIHRHSGAVRAEVAYEIAPSEAVLRVRDYGCGIPIEVLDKFRATGLQVGVGLAGMRERIRELGGDLTIDSGSRGVTIAVRMLRVETSQSQAAAPRLLSTA